MNEDGNTKHDFEKNSQNRIEELIAELSDCREDERNSNNQILQVISVVGTILSILFGISYLNAQNKNDPLVIFQSVNTDNVLDHLCNLFNQNITYARVMFWLGLLVFATAFTYITVLGINNILRYYYIQTIEDRLHNMISSAPDDNDRGVMLHWNAYCAPIITRNPKHITSTHSALYYFCYTITTICIVVFSMGMVASLFQQINPRRWFDTLLLLIVLIAMALTFFLFLRLSANAESVAQFAWDVAHENHKIRMGQSKQEIYGKAKSFRRIFWYLFYPKKQDLQKPFLIIIGFLCGMVLTGVKIEAGCIYRLLFVLFVFDFLAYQARYQINDIRGIEEDREVGAKNRLIADDITNERHVTKISAIVALTRILVALLLTLIFGGATKELLLVSLGILFVATVIYEVARTNNNDIIWPIFFSVGIGYPLRFFLGFVLVIPERALLLNPQTICLAIALGAYGSFSSILSWINQITERLEHTSVETDNFPPSYKKKHFRMLQRLIFEKYNNAKLHTTNHRVFPLREKCQIYEVWNIIFIISLLFLMLTAFMGNISKILLFVELIICISFAFNGCLYNRKKLILIGIGWCGIVVKVIIATLTLENYVWYILLSGIQYLVTITYFILCYQPQMKELNWKQLFKKIYNLFLKIVLGEYVANMFQKQ